MKMLPCAMRKLAVEKVGEDKQEKEVVGCKEMAELENQMLVMKEGETRAGAGTD